MGIGDFSRRERQLMKIEAEAMEAVARLQAESWRESDRHLLAKEERAKAKEAKMDAKAAARRERKDLEATEEAANATLPGANKGATVKVTQAEIARRQALMSAVGQATRRKSTRTQVVPQPKLEENTNRRRDLVEASGLDGALRAFEGGQSTVTFAEFEQRMQAELREEKPGLKMSQMRDHVLKAWARSPENPKNACR